jgi:hypothetical protein
MLEFQRSYSVDEHQGLLYLSSNIDSCDSKDGTEERRFSTDNAQLWSYVKDVSQELPLEAIARVYALRHQVMNVITHAMLGTLLIDSNFDDLRAAVRSTDDESKRFRQLVANSVMATSIIVKELETLRNNRLEKDCSGGALKSLAHLSEMECSSI